MSGVSFSLPPCRERYRVLARLKWARSVDFLARLKWARSVGQERRRAEDEEVNLMQREKIEKMYEFDDDKGGDGGSPRIVSPTPLKPPKSFKFSYDMFISHP